MTTLRLDVAFVPEGCEYHNLQVPLASAEIWKQIEKVHFDAANHRCVACQEVGRPPWQVELHESWDFDSVERVQTFRGFHVLCPACHEVKHFALALKAGRGQKCVEHFCRVNKVTPVWAESYLKAAIETWAASSTLGAWTANLTVLFEVAPAHLWWTKSPFNDDLSAWADLRALREVVDPKRRHVLFRLPEPTILEHAHRGHY